MTKPIIGILGGGQLGMMLCDAAKEIDIETHVPKYRFKESFKLKETRDGDVINFYDDKINTARFYFDKVLPRAEQHYKSAISGSSNIMNFKFN